MNTLELVLKSGRRLLAFFLDFSVGCPNIICLHLLGILWKFGAWWLTIWLLIMWLPKHHLSTPYGLVFSHSGFLCNFSNVFESLGWMWGVLWVWAGFGAEWLSGIVWIWAWQVLVSWWLGVASGSACVPSYNNSGASLSLHLVGWSSD